MIKYFLLVIVLLAFVSGEIVSPIMAYEECNLCLIDHCLEGESENENESEKEEQLKDSEKLHVYQGIFAGLLFNPTVVDSFSYAPGISDSFLEKITPPPRSLS